MLGFCQLLSTRQIFLSRGTNNSFCIFLNCSKLYNCGDFIIPTARKRSMPSALKLVFASEYFTSVRYIKFGAGATVLVRLIQLSHMFTNTSEAFQ